MKGIPEGASVVIPRLICRDPVAEIEFCANTFGAVERVRRPYVEDVDQTLERAVAGGAKVLIQAKDQFWGDRMAGIMDPSRHVWTIATRIEETTAQEREDRWASIQKSSTA